MNTVAFIQNNNVAYYKLETRGTSFPVQYQSESYIKVITSDIRYGISLITSIWRKDFLLKVLDNKDYTAWEFEIHRNEPNDLTKSTDELCLCDERNILHIVHVVQRSKYIPSALRKFAKRGYKINVSKRGKLSILFDIYLTVDERIKKYKKLHSFIISFFGKLGIKPIAEKYAIESKNKKYK